MRKVIPVLLVGAFALALLVPAPVNAVVARGHWRIHQDQFDPDPATDLHFTIWQKESWVTIDTFLIVTTIDGNCAGSSISPTGNDSLSADRHEVYCERLGEIFYCCWIDIDATLELSSWNTVHIKDVVWTNDPLPDELDDDMPDNGWDVCMTEDTQYNDGWPQDDIKMRFMYYNDDDTRSFTLKALQYDYGTDELTNAQIWAKNTGWITDPYEPTEHPLDPAGYMILNCDVWPEGAEDWFYFKAEIWVGATLVAEVRGQHEIEGYTAVSLASFEAIGYDDHVEINWTTGNEINNAGFNIYRSTSRDGEKVKINDVLIPARGDEISGATYSYVDRGFSDGTNYYWFEDVSLDGNRSVHGPALASRKPAVPVAFTLAQNYPNPFNP
ncbi:MAG: hypothetical protein JSV33_13020, partial [bacterium]